MSQANLTDIVIIGSGVAGALLAKAFANAGLRVHVLEAGEHWQRDTALEQYQASSNRNITAPFKQADWTLTPADKNYFSKQSTQAYQPSFLKGVGGTTWHWTAITPRFLPSDFKLYSNYAVGSDWPINYNDLEPYYNQAEIALGVSGDSINHHGSPRSQAYPMPAIPMTYGDKIIAKKLTSTGLTIAPLPAARNSQTYDHRPACQGNNTCTPLCPIGASYSANTDIKKALDAGAILINKAVVYQLDIDQNNHITQAHYLHPDGSSHSIKAQRFIIACNSIETARLLLLSSNSSTPNGLANTSGQVGRNLMDHTIIVSKFHMPEPLYIGRGPQSVSTILTGRDGSFRKQYAAAKFFLGNDLNIHQETAQLLQDDQHWIDPLKKLRNIAIHQGQIGAEIEQLASPNNRLKLDNTHLDPLGLPLPSIKYQLSNYTQKAMHHWSSYIQKLIQHMGATPTATSTSLSSHHPTGTTRMGTLAKNSVVNPNCQSHDHKNLYIIGGSVFPSIGTANPTLTIAALSLRLANHILQEIKSQKT